MKIRFSPIVSGASGKAADLVAASWKGRPYIRKLVIPANPNSTDQQAVRNSLTRCVSLWRSLGTGCKEWLNTYGVDYRMSGFNIFLSKNRALEQLESLLKHVPDNPYCPLPSTFAAAAGGSGIITVTWVNNAPTAYTHIIAYARLAAANLFEAETLALKGALTLNLAGLTPGATYDVYASFYKDADDKPFGTSTGKLNQAAGA